MPERKVKGGIDPSAWKSSSSNRTRRSSSEREPQIVRALALLLEMARSRRGLLLKAFAEKHGYPLRNVYRARDVLIKVGAPVRQNPESPTRWQLMEGWLPAAVVGAPREELMALFVARHLAPGLRDTSVGRALDALWSKLASGGPQHALPLESPEMPFSIRALPAISYGTHRVTLDRLQEAITARHAVRIRYRTPDGAESERVIEPGFLHWDGALEAIYVPSWCRLRSAVRVFAVHRILAADPLSDDPAGAIPARRILERAFRIWHRDAVEDVEVFFTRRVAGEIRERQWHASQHLRDAPDGGVYLRLSIAAPEELQRWLLGFGPDARVIEPARLADQLRIQHAEAAGIGQVLDASAPRARGEAVKPVSSVASRARRSR